MRRLRKTASFWDNTPMKKATKLWAQKINATQFWAQKVITTVWGKCPMTSIFKFLTLKQRKPGAFVFRHFHELKWIWEKALEKQQKVIFNGVSGTLSELPWWDQLKSQKSDYNVLGGATTQHKCFNNPVALLWPLHTL